MKLATKNKKKIWKHTRRSLALAVLALGVILTRHALAKHRQKTINTNESQAISALKNMSSAQAQLQASGHVDTNRNGAGEFGDFHEMREVLSAAFTRGTPTRVEVQGYIYELYLPDSPEHREVAWSIYAWPADYGRTGRRAFFLDQHGCILSTGNTLKRYSGTTALPEATAAFTPDSTRARAANTFGADGQRWTII
jgi:hypothetical protein